MREAPNDGRKAFKILKDHNRPKGKPRIIALYTELTSLNKNHNESMTDYIIRAETTASSLRDAGETVSDGLLIAMVLKGLPADYKPFATVVTQSPSTKTFQEFKVSLRNYEETHKAYCQNSNSETAILNLQYRKYASNSKPHNRWCSHCKSGTHNTKDYWKKEDSTGTKTTKQRRWCNHCKSPTHDTTFCRHKAKQALHNQVSQNQENKSSDSKHFNFKITEICENKEDSVNAILVDSGATSHITCDEKKFTRFSEKFNHTKNHTLELADGSRSGDLIKNIGEAQVEIIDTNGVPRKAVLHNALYVPSFNQDIFSVRAATENGATFHSARTRVTSIQMERILASPRETTSTNWIRHHQFRFLHRAMFVC